MDDNKNFVCDYCEARISIIVSALFLLKTGYTQAELFMGKLYDK